MKAWLVTWKWFGTHAAVENPIVSILSVRLSENTVRRHVEQLYADLTYEYSERLDVARSAKKNMYPAKFVQISGVRWRGQIECGHNPHLFARTVEDIRVEIGDDGAENLVWNEIKRPEFPNI